MSCGFSARLKSCPCRLSQTEKSSTNRFVEHRYPSLMCLFLWGRCVGRVHLVRKRIQSGWGRH
jgi:hypothetical protein